MPRASRPAKITALAAMLHDNCAARGVVLVPGRAEEILTKKIREIATDTGLTETAVIDTYLTTDRLDQIARALADANQPYLDALATAEPVPMTTPGAGGVIAALGLMLKLAVNAAGTNEGHSRWLNWATDCADAVTGIGTALRAADTDGDVLVPGPSAVYARHVLTTGLDAITTGTWTCPCGTRHQTGVPCRVQDAIARDLIAIGGHLSTS
jgi:hypothetical protein